MASRSERLSLRPDDLVDTGSSSRLQRRCSLPSCWPPPPLPAERKAGQLVRRLGQCAGMSLELPRIGKRYLRVPGQLSERRDRPGLPHSRNEHRPRPHRLERRVVTFIDSVDHSSGHDVGQGTSVFAETHTDGADFYSAAGVFEFRRTFHEVEHFTASNGVVPGRPEQGPLPLLRRLLTRTRCD